MAFKTKRILVAFLFVVLNISRLLFLTKLFVISLKSSWGLELSELGLIDFTSHAEKFTRLNYKQSVIFFI